MPQPLRIATFNLESLDDRPDVAPPLAARIAVLRPQLLRLKADVLCLQEVNGQRPPGGGPRQLLALERLLAETPYAGFHLISSSRVSGPDSEAERGADAVHNLVILSRHPFGSTEELRHHLVEPPTYRPKTARPAVEREQAIEWDRPILAAAIELAAGRRLHVVNLHLRAPLAAPVPGQKKDAHTWRSVSGWAEGFFLATVKRAGQALETRLFIERIFDHDARALVAVCGDFNAEERQTPAQDHPRRSRRYRQRGARGARAGAARAHPARLAALLRGPRRAQGDARPRAGLARAARLLPPRRGPQRRPGRRAERRRPGLAPRPPGRRVRAVRRP